MFSKILTLAAAANAAYLRGGSPGNMTVVTNSSTNVTAVTAVTAVSNALIVQPSKALVVYRGLQPPPPMCPLPTPWYRFSGNTTATK